MNNYNSRCLLYPRSLILSLFSYIVLIQLQPSHSLRCSAPLLSSYRIPKNLRSIHLKSNVLPINTAIQELQPFQDRVIQLNKSDGSDTLSDFEIIPFVVERIENNYEKDFREISQMCIEVFFNELNGDGIAVFKSLQLGYLRNAQYSDLRMRRYMAKDKNDMFIARKVIPYQKDKQRIMDLKRIFNADYLPGDGGRVEYAAGEILGFAEVTKKPFGLGAEDEFSETGTTRPVIANVAVKRKARRCGIGSKLVDACEDIVMSWIPKFSEIILEVDEDNPRAQNFYRKRGYQEVFSNPTCRRYDTSGYFLKEVRTTKICMKKNLVLEQAKKEMKNVVLDSNAFGKFWKAIS